MSRDPLAPLRKLVADYGAFYDDQKRAEPEWLRVVRGVLATVDREADCGAP